MSHSLRSVVGAILLGASITVGGTCAAFGADLETDGGPVWGHDPAHSVAWPAVKSAVTKDPRLEARIAELLGKLSLEQKVAQMVQADIRSITPEDERKYHIGSILTGGGAFPGNNKHAAISDWVTLADRFYDASMDTSRGAAAIPEFWGVRRRSWS